MSITYKFRYKKTTFWKKPILTFRTGEGLGMNKDNMVGSEAYKNK